MGGKSIGLGRDERGPRRTIGSGRPALLVAELGQNHNGSQELAERLVDAAAWAGADAVKVVKRDLDCELCREARDRPYPTPHAYGETYGEHRRALELSPEIHASLARRAREHGMLFIATACDLPSADQMAAIGVDAFKIASRDLTNLPLIRHVARVGEPLLLSTGMSSWNEIDEAVEALASLDVPFVLLQCTSLYPAPLDEIHLKSLGALAKAYGVLVGFSDHSPGVLLPPVAVALGAVVVEKHLTLDRQWKGTDHACSLEPDEFRQLVENTRSVERALGSAEKPLAPGVEVSRAKLGRSLVTRYPLAAGTRIEETMLTLKSPGDGVSWLERRLVVGHKLKRAIAADEKITREILD